ncbi:MAG: apolipoprotein N-acyltransferase [Flavobacteriales bacterium]|nr:apolipoprotein N-acyltransferase [Flavobacteriales bacterium]
MRPTRAHVLCWSALSGVLWAIAWPAIGGMAVLAFVAWLPLLHAERLHETRTENRRRAFYPYVLAATFIWNLSCSWWFFAVSEPMTTRLVSVGAPVICNTLFMGLPWLLTRWVAVRWNRRWSHLAFAACWLAFERLHHDWDLQWPWFSLGNVFGEHPAWVQWYEGSGILGGSLWVLALNLLLDSAIASWRSARREAYRKLAIALLVIAVPLIGSFWRFHTYPESKPGGVQVVVVQPNVDPYTEKFGGLDSMDQLERMLALARPLITPDTRLVVFPETALQETGSIRLGPDGLIFKGLWENALDSARSVIRLRAFQAEHPQVALLCGMSSDRWFSDEGERPSTARPIGDSRYWYEAYNAALWLPVRGGTESYHKSKLVAGVESMPFERVLGHLGELALDLGGTTGSLGQQQERSVLRDAASGLAIVPAICYESVFGEHIAAHVRNGGELIVVMTNDGWWDNTPGYRQHLTFSSLRAIETRRDVVRSANTGISCIVDQRGVIRAETDWWVPTAFRANVHPNESVTFFVRYGDLVGRSAIWVSLLFLVATLWHWFRRTRSV